MNRSDWPLLILAAVNGMPLTTPYVGKILFLLQRDLPEAFAGCGYEFELGGYGPRPLDLCQDLDTLTALELIQESFLRGMLVQHGATLKGLAAAAELEKTLPSRVANHVHKLTSWAHRLDWFGLVNAVITKYPDTAANYVFKERA